MVASEETADLCRLFLDRRLLVPEYEYIIKAFSSFILEDLSESGEFTAQTIDFGTVARFTTKAFKNIVKNLFQ